MPPTKRTHYEIRFTYEVPRWDQTWMKVHAVLTRSNRASAERLLAEARTMVAGSVGMGPEKYKGWLLKHGLRPEGVVLSVSGLYLVVTESTRLDTPPPAP